MSERWLPIAGYEGYYEVSDQGRVRSLDRVVKTARGQRRIRGRLLSQSVAHEGGYVQVNLNRDGEREHVYVHVLVLEHFEGPRPPGMEGCHGPGGSSDNRLSNLRWDTPSANQRDKRRDGTDHNANKTHCGTCAFPYDEANTIWFGPEKKWRRCRNCERRHARNRYIRRKESAA